MRWLCTALVPPCVALAIAGGAPDDARGLFQAHLGALVAVAATCAFAVRARIGDAVALVVGAGLCAVVHLAWRGTDGAFALAVLVAGSGAASSGLAAVGRAIGASALPCGALGAAVVWAAMSGVFWADDVAASLPYGKQHAFRQAVLHADAATACAYGVAHFDRLHDPVVYARARLAETLLTRPDPLPTGALWLCLGLLAWTVAVWRGADREAAATDDDEPS